MIAMQELLMTLDVGLIYGLVAIGIYLTFRTINFADMTCDGSFVFGSSICAVMVQGGVSPSIAVLAALFGGALAGGGTGILNIYCKISDLLSGILVAFMLYSVNLKVMGNLPNITFVEDISPSTLQLLLVVICIAATFVYLLFTDFGLGLRAIGYNKRFSEISGINTKTMTLIGLILSNAMIGLGGALFTQYQGFCDVSQGKGTLVAGLAAVIIGERICKFRSVPFAIFACIVGSIVYRAFIMLALHSSFLHIETQDINLVAGGIIILMMLARRERSRC